MMHLLHRAHDPAVDEREAALALYPPRESKPPGCSRAIISVTVPESAGPPPPEVLRWDWPGDEP